MALEEQSLTAQLRAVADDIRRGGSVRSLGPAGRALPEDVRSALEGVFQAFAAREEDRRIAAERNEDVLLALEELARDQAFELATQNEELRRQNEALLEANRHKGEFVTTVSHELRAPLTAVIGFSELMLQGLTGPLGDEQQQYIGDIHRAGKHLLRLIDDILDLAKVEAGRMEFHRHSLDLAAPVREAEEIAQAMAMKKRQKLTVRSEGFVRCVGDLQRIRQVALNLFSNAVKFTPEGGTITATVRQVGEMAELSVQDSGIGIDPEHHAYVFEAFRQLDSSNTRSHQGTGLGLALVKRFVERMGGTISLESRRGGGATFTVRLPTPESTSQVAG